MKIYISANEPTTKDYIHVSNIMTLDTVSLDNEANEIIIENYLSQFSQEEIEPLLKKILTKLRLNGALVIVDNDIDTAVMKYDRGDIDLVALNQIVFRGQARKCVLNIETIKDTLQNSLKIEHSSIDSNSGNFILKLRRSTNG